MITTKHHKGMTGGIWVKYPTPKYEQTPTGWVEAKLNEAEIFFEESVEEVRQNLQRKIGQAIWEVLRGNEEWLSQEKQQLEHDYGVKLADPPSNESILKEALDHALDEAEW